MTHTLKTALATAVALTAFSAAAMAAPAVGLVGDKTLVMFDTDRPEVTKTLEATGVDRLLGIDLRPADGMLYGVAANGALVTIDTTSGAATEISRLDTMLPEGVSAMVDFNPAADKLRVMGSDGTNLRVDPASGKVTTDGKLAFEEGDAGSGKTPNIVATAYINSYGKPEKTAMYDISADGTFIQQTKPNDGALKTIGELGVTSDSYAMDVQTTADGVNTIWLVAAGALHTIDMKSGKASRTGDIKGADGAIRDVTILPAM